jgi:hypothetical protein
MQWFKIRLQNEKKQVYDPLRRRYVALTPEEEVRQNTLYQLINSLKVPQSLIAVEYSLKMNGLQKRCDIVIFSNEGKPVMIVECKAESVSIDQSVLEQAARYNFKLKVNYLWLTNGKSQYCCQINSENGQLDYLDFVPDYNVICRK